MYQALVDKKRNRLYSTLEVCCIVLLALVPLFISYPYRVNIFLSWEGAYRLSQGQVPFKDFGIPMGYMYWVVPAFFFKLFGAQLITLIKAQVFINVISGLAFRSILKSLSVQPGIRLLSVLLYCISFSFFNFWPWYNHTVIVYEVVGLAFLMRYLFAENKMWILLSLSALFIFFSFFTKQDGGFLAFLICLALLFYHAIYERKWGAVLIFLTSTLIIAFAVIAPLTRFNFGYWFNHGQPPHTARLSIFEVLDEFLYSSLWIKFYLLAVGVILLASYRSITQLAGDKKRGVFLLLTLGILAESAILQVTSYTPPDNNIFFHSFAFAFIFSVSAEYLNLDLYRWRSILSIAILLLFWWSGVFWKYIQGPIHSFFPESKPYTKENIVNRHNYILSPPTGEIPLYEWSYSNLHSFKNIRMPKATVDGINRLLNIPSLKNERVKVLNMSELTPLAAEIPYQLETGVEIPLWYHLGVSMFNKEAEDYERKIASKHYDLVLFEYIPTLNNFYPFRVRDVLEKYYNKIDSFPAPRRGNTQGQIEIFVK
jgi:hypothetical protein